MPDFLEQKRNEITKRLSELRPLVDEYHRLEAASTALAQVGGSSNGRSARTTARRRPGRPRSSTSTTTRSAAASRTRTTRRATQRRTGTGSAGRRPGRRRGSGARTAQTLALVQAQPAGITIPELAQKMGIKQNYLYRVLPALQKEGKVSKRGRTWLPRAGAAAS